MVSREEEGGGTFDISIGGGKGREGESEWHRHTLMGGRRKREVVPPRTKNENSGALGEAKKNL